MPNFSTYQPPGVYIEEDLTALVSTIGVRPAVVALVGPSVGYRTNVEAVTLTAETAVDLSKEGVDTATLVVKSLSGTTYVLDADYTVTVAAGVTSVARKDAGGSITSGDVVYVSYEYTDTDYFTPMRATDFDDVVDAYGPPFNYETGTITSPLSFAAKIAFENGARELVLVATTGAAAGPVTRDELTAAYTKVAALWDVTIVVPIAVGVTGTAVAPGDTYNIGTDLQTHVEQASDQGLFRIGVLGYEKDVTIDPVEAAGNFSSKRVILAWPNRMNFYNGFLNQTMEISGYYLAAAYAGRMASLQVQMPLTKKRVFGFTGLPASIAQTMTMALRNDWSKGGVAVTEVTRQGQLVVRHGTTTDRTNVQTREISLIRAKDALVVLMQETVENAQLIGTYIDEDTPGRVKGVVAGALESAKGDDVIVDYNGLKIRQLPGDPTILECKFEYKPAYPLNYIVISFSISTETGTVTVTET